MQAPKDRLTKTLAIVAIACFLFALVLFVGYKLSLDSGASGIAASANQVRS